MQSFIQATLLSCPAPLLALLPVALIVWALRALGRNGRQQILDKAKKMKSKPPPRQRR